MKTFRPARPPPTRNHWQLAEWINGSACWADVIVDSPSGRILGGPWSLYKPEGSAGRVPVYAKVEQVRTSTDQKIRGTRLRLPGRGRRGLKLEVWAERLNSMLGGDPGNRLFEHESSETYRRHREAREWVERYLLVQS